MARAQVCRDHGRRDKLSVMQRFYSITAVALSMTLLAGTGGYTWSQRPEQIPEFSSMQPKAKKQAFFAVLQPKIQYANNRIARDRAWLMQARTTPLALRSSVTVTVIVAPAPLPAPAGAAAASAAPSASAAAARLRRWG